MGGSYSGSTALSKSARVGSIPTPPANKTFYRETKEASRLEIQEIAVKAVFCYSINVH